MVNLKKVYFNKILINNKDIIIIKNSHQLPILKKITLNFRLFPEIINIMKNKLEFVKVLKIIFQQLPLFIATKASISNFSIRKKSLNTSKLTLRGSNIWLFLTTFILVSIPKYTFNKIKPQKSLGLDKQGNVTLGFSSLEDIIFNIELNSLIKKISLNLNLYFKHQIRNSSLSNKIIKKIVKNLNLF